MLDKIGLAPDLAAANIAPAVGHANRRLVIDRRKLAAFGDKLMLVEDDEPIASHLSVMNYRAGP